MNIFINPELDETDRLIVKVLMFVACLVGVVALCTPILAAIGLLP